ncbi:MAG TPA: DUF4349 domain-containing protein [Gaiellaceae bacterium]|nr:DUF4349 domain-containing protein [Gaiellaceae bacterium]
MSPELTAALRGETPTAPVELRERVALIAAAVPPHRRWTFPVRRALLLAAPAAAVGSLAVALVVGAISSSTPPAPTAGARAEIELQPLTPEAGERAGTSRDLAPRLTPAPSTRRAQDYQATLRILVDDPSDLSTATQTALRTTRRLGGYVVTVQYGTPEPSEGTANLRVRIPVSRVQAAIVSFNGLGRILAQQTQVTDLQQRLDELTRQLRRAKGNKARIAALRRQRTELNRRAAFATLAVDLTTHEPEKKAASPGRLERAVDDATGVLTAELAIGAYALIVASPFLLLLAAAFAANRAYRRYADQRLLERA